MQQQVPTLLFPPPPPPPLTPYYSSSLSSSSPASASSHHVSLSITSLPILLLTVLGILTTSILLLVYYIFVIRCCLAWHADSSDVSRSRRRRPGGGAISGDDGLPVARGAPGLEEPAIRALPAFRYRKAVKNDAAVESGECAVCLGEFQEEERVRLLPSCLHVFHVGCIDTWLHTNANCPLCRAAITTTTTSQLPLMDQLLRPREVVIQVQAVGTEEEGNMAAAGSEGDVAFLQINMSAAREMRALQRG